MAKAELKSWRSPRGSRAAPPDAKKKALSPASS
jgi:hypothetical protein